MLCETGITDVKNGSRSGDNDILPFDRCFYPQLSQSLKMEGKIFIIGLCLCTDSQGLIDELETFYTSDSQSLLQDYSLLLSQIVVPHSEPEQDQIGTGLY